MALSPARPAPHRGRGAPHLRACRVAFRAAWAALIAALLCAASRPGVAQDAAPLASYTTSRLLVAPAQDVAGAGSGRAWLTRFDSVFTVRLEDAGIGSGWAYARDAVRYQRQNPSYLADPRALGAQALRGDRVTPGVALPEPFASRIRALVAIADARYALIPVAAVIDTAASPRTVSMRLVAIDARLAKVVSVHAVRATFAGGEAAAADAAAAEMARLFVR